MSSTEASRAPAPFATVASLSDAMRTGALSPVDVVRFYLERIERLNPLVHAFITVTGDEALQRAAVAEADIAAGNWRGPLHGIPFAVKDVYETEGIRTTAHSYALRDWVPERDATSVERLGNAGAILVGKLATAEFSTGAQTEGPFPAARNPWNLDYTAAGSSSGSGAAVAAGMCPLTMGGDTGGSIRFPAAANGTVGLRPTYGRVPKRGVIPLSWSQDTVGPLALTVADCAAALQVVAGYDPQDPSSANVPVPDFSARLGTSIDGFRLGVDRKHFLHEMVQPQVRAAFEAALDVLRGLGAEIVDIELPWLEYAHAAQNVIHMTETHTYQAPGLSTNPKGYGPSARAYFRLGAFISGPDYLNAQRVRAKVRGGIVGALARLDAIVTPMTSTIGERADAVNTKNRFKTIAGKPNLAIPFSQAGVPALSLPCGFAEEGMPLGLQIAGKPFDEATVFAVAAAYERATPWHERHPRLGQ